MSPSYSQLSVRVLKKNSRTGQSLCLHCQPTRSVHFFAFAAYYTATEKRGTSERKKEKKKNPGLNDTDPHLFPRSRSEEGKSILNRCLCSHIFKVTVTDHGCIPERGEEKPQTWGDSEKERCNRAFTASCVFVVWDSFSLLLTIELIMKSHIMSESVHCFISVFVF